MGLGSALRLLKALSRKEFRKGKYCWIHKCQVWF